MKNKNVLLGLITVAGLGIGYYLFGKKKPPAIAEAPITNSAPPPPEKVDREKTAHDYIENLFKRNQAEKPALFKFSGPQPVIGGESGTLELGIGNGFSTDGINVYDENHHIVTNPSSVQLIAKQIFYKQQHEHKPETQVEQYNYLLEQLNKITDDNDVILFMKYLGARDTLDAQIFFGKFFKKYPTVKID